MSVYLQQIEREAAAQRQFLKHIKSGYVADLPHSAEETAALLGISRKRVKQIEALAVRKLKLGLRGCDE